MIKYMLVCLIACPGIARANPEIAGTLFSPATPNEPLIVLPLKRTEVTIEVTGAIAQTQVIQRFHNDLNRPLEAIYLFPLPSEAAITDFEIRLKDRVIHSRVQERKEAKITYEKAKAAGKKVALLDQERPNLFTTSVANLLPGETVEICFTYAETLRFQKDRYDITFPMVVGTRYIPFAIDSQGQPHTSVTDASRLNPPVLPPNIHSDHRLSIQVNLHGLPIQQVTSTTHAIRVTHPRSSGTHVSLAKPDGIPHSEFNITVHLEPNQQPELSFIQSVTDEETYGLLSVFPPIGKIKKGKSHPKDITFLIDTSGSMSGESIAQARSGLARCLKNLSPNDRFTLIRFADEFSWFSPEFRTATPEKIEEALEYVAGLTADGGTEMQQALEYAMDIPSISGQLPILIFLTDGDIGNEESILTLLSQKLGNTRLFTFGIGSAPNEFLLHRMAEVGRGQSRFIRSHEDIGDVMTDLFQTLETPVLTDITLEWDNPALHAYPERCPDIFQGRPLQLVVHSPEKIQGQLTLRAQRDGTPVEYNLTLNNQSDANHPAIPHLYGRMKLKHLMLKKMQANTSDEREQWKTKITQTALKYQLVSKSTSRIAVEERIVIENGEAISVNVPVLSPKGWRLNRTATHDPLLLLTGTLCLLGAILFRKITHA